MGREQSSTAVAGIDVGKARLDAALSRGEEEIAAANTAAGHAELIAWLRAHGVARVGLEASGGYERGIRSALEAAGFQVVVHQPLEVRLFARLTRQRAKNDRLDARLIALATERADTVRAAQDPRLQALAELLSVYEHLADAAARHKAHLASLTGEIARRMVQARIAEAVRAKAEVLARVLAAIRQAPDLAERLRLLTSLPGIGETVAASLVVRMPELGAMRRGQPASLAGLAPFDRDSGQWRGERFIQGGRARPRRMLYLAALAARRHDPGLRAFADRLASAGKPKKVVLVAVMRKLVETANLVLARAQPWTTQPA